MNNNKKVIFWDFDGVLMDSNAVRDLGFEKVLADFPEEQVQQLMDFHRNNGGLSRYVKFRHFFETIRKEELTDEKLKNYTDRFSEIMLSLLLDESLLIQPTINFVKNNYHNYKMHIVSGSDQTELRKICVTLNLSQYFVSIHGSPTPKKQWIKDLLEENQYDLKDCVLIGDSHNDFEAADVNRIDFWGYGNEKITALSTVNFSLE
ncbi:MAG TPA: HAD hydrolase-like protein [Flavobacterium sp.]|uniref:HAD family hydrolase n=1 Tax=Flavobacterium sp. TaxID=239 RepID=UPI002D1C385D|nr:HAD hydrolase-like protein [Flavobacterium sp.]HNP33573.1 HAD hydrolase-like protein [Flavobacterium sp.]